MTNFNLGEEVNMGGGGGGGPSAVRPSGNAFTALGGLFDLAGGPPKAPTRGQLEDSRLKGYGQGLQEVAALRDANKHQEADATWEKLRKNAAIDGLDTSSGQVAAMEESFLGESYQGIQEKEESFEDQNQGLINQKMAVLRAQNPDLPEEEMRNKAIEMAQEEVIRAAGMVGKFKEDWPKISTALNEQLLLEANEYFKDPSRSLTATSAQQLMAELGQVHSEVVAAFQKSMGKDFTQEVADEIDSFFDRHKKNFEALVTQAGKDSLEANATKFQSYLFNKGLDGPLSQGDVLQIVMTTFTQGGGVTGIIDKLSEGGVFSKSDEEVRSTLDKIKDAYNDYITDDSEVADWFETAKASIDFLNKYDRNVDGTQKDGTTNQTPDGTPVVQDREANSAATVGKVALSVAFAKAEQSKNFVDILEGEIQDSLKHEAESGDLEGVNRIIETQENLGRAVINDAIKQTNQRAGGLQDNIKPGGGSPNVQMGMGAIGVPLLSVDEDNNVSINERSLLKAYQLVAGDRYNEANFVPAVGKAYRDESGAIDWMAAVEDNFNALKGQDIPGLYAFQDFVKERILGNDSNMMGLKAIRRAEKGLNQWGGLRTAVNPAAPVVEEEDPEAATTEPSVTMGGTPSRGQAVEEVSFTDFATNFLKGKGFSEDQINKVVEEINEIGEEAYLEKMQGGEETSIYFNEAVTKAIMADTTGEEWANGVRQAIAEAKGVDASEVTDVEIEEAKAAQNSGEVDTDKAEALEALKGMPPSEMQAQIQGQKSQRRLREEGTFDINIYSDGQKAAPVSNLIQATVSSLITTEARGGNAFSWNSRNYVDGSDGVVGGELVTTGHYGRLQFGPARLQEAQEAGVMPPDMTVEEFLKSPETQVAVENWHLTDHIATIQRKGWDSLIGTRVNGTLVTMSGMLAGAHLGGIGSLGRYLKGGGNSRDANGTSIGKYMRLHASAETVPIIQATFSVAEMQTYLGDDHDKFDVAFGNNLVGFLQAAKKAGVDISLNSGWRSLEQQAQILANNMTRPERGGFTKAERDQWLADVAKYGAVEALTVERDGRNWTDRFTNTPNGQSIRRWIGLPGGSKHQHGLAADLGYGNDAAEKWAHENAGKYGLHFRMAHEPWHIELIGGASVATGYNHRTAAHAKKIQDYAKETGISYIEASNFFNFVETTNSQEFSREAKALAQDNLSSTVPEEAQGGGQPAAAVLAAQGLEAAVAEELGGSATGGESLSTGNSGLEMNDGGSRNLLTEADIKKAKRAQTIEGMGEVAEIEKAGLDQRMQQADEELERDRSKMLRAKDVEISDREKGFLKAAGGGPNTPAFNTMNEAMEALDAGLIEVGDLVVIGGKGYKMQENM